jgi:hypothetical protein
MTINYAESIGPFFITFETKRANDCLGEKLDWKIFTNFRKRFFMTEGEPDAKFPAHITNILRTVSNSGILR